MFKNYYKILNIAPSSTDDEIKKAYRRMSIQWHPDKNPCEDVTQIMQDINEAYAILKDTEKRKRYDAEYIRFCETVQYEREQNEKPANETYSQSTWSYDYDIQDNDLKENIKDAQQYAKDLVEEFLKHLKETSKIAAKGATKNATNYTIGWVISGIFLAIIGSLMKTCS